MNQLQILLIIAQDILDIMLSFFKTRRLPKRINTTYITLLFKTTDPTEFKEFGPISMIHGIYKIITKILASRLKMLCKTSLALTNQFS